jgi:hypothetical protein
MASAWVRRAGRAAVAAAMVLASAVAVVVWFPHPKRLRKPRPDQLVGRPAPRVAERVEEWLQGEEFEVRRGPGQATLLLFWHPRDGGKSEPWIAPVVRWAEEFESRGLITLGVCVVDAEDAAELVLPVIRRHEIPFRMALDCDGDLHLDFLIDKKHTPYCYLVDGSGRIVWGGHPEALDEEDIEGALSR